MADNFSVLDELEAQLYYMETGEVMARKPNASDDRSGGTSAYETNAYAADHNAEKPAEHNGKVGSTQDGKGYEHNVDEVESDKSSIASHLVDEDSVTGADQKYTHDDGVYADDEDSLEILDAKSKEDGVAAAGEDGPAPHATGYDGNYSSDCEECWNESLQQRSGEASPEKMVSEPGPTANIDTYDGGTSGESAGEQECYNLDDEDDGKTAESDVHDDAAALSDNNPGNATRLGPRTPEYPSDKSDCVSVSDGELDHHRESDGQQEESYVKKEKRGAPSENENVQDLTLDDESECPTAVDPEAGSECSSDHEAEDHSESAKEIADVSDGKSEPERESANELEHSSGESRRNSADGNETNSEAKGANTLQGDFEDISDTESKDCVAQSESAENGDDKTGVLGAIAEILESVADDDGAQTDAVPEVSEGETSADKENTEPALENDDGDADGVGVAKRALEDADEPQTKRRRSGRSQVNETEKVETTPPVAKTKREPKPKAEPKQKAVKEKVVKANPVKAKAIPKPKATKAVPVKRAPGRPAVQKPAPAKPQTASKRSERGRTVMPRPAPVARLSRSQPPVKKPPAAKVPPPAARGRRAAPAAQKEEQTSKGKDSEQTVTRAGRNVPQRTTRGKTAPAVTHKEETASKVNLVEAKSTRSAPTKAAPKVTAKAPTRAAAKAPTRAAAKAPTRAAAKAPTRAAAKAPTRATPKAPTKSAPKKAPTKAKAPPKATSKRGVQANKKLRVTAAKKAPRGAKQQDYGPPVQVGVARVAISHRRITKLGKLGRELLNSCKDCSVLLTKLQQNDELMTSCFNDVEMAEQKEEEEEVVEAKAEVTAE